MAYAVIVIILYVTLNGAKGGAPPAVRDRLVSRALVLEEIAGKVLVAAVVMACIGYTGMWVSESLSSFPGDGWDTSAGFARTVLIVGLVL